MKILSVLTILSTAAICCLLVGVVGNPVDLAEFDIQDDNDTTTVIPTTNPASTSDEAQSSTILPNTTMFTGSTPISFVTSEQSPVTGNSSGSTDSSSAVTGTASSLKTSPTMTPPLGSTQPSTGGFDGRSFAGGIALGIGLLLIVVFTYKCYVMRQKGQQNYKAM